MAFKITSFTEAIGGSVALVALVALPLLAQAADPASTAHAHAPSAASNMVVVIDAVTGQLRAPTPAEAKAAAERAPAARGTAGRTMPKVSAGGARGARLTDDFMHYSVAVRQPDGSLRELCFSTQEEADAALKPSSAPSHNSLPTQ